MALFIFYNHLYYVLYETNILYFNLSSTNLIYPFAKASFYINSNLLLFFNNTVTIGYYFKL